MSYLSERKLNEIRGKASIGHATTKEVMSVFEHLDALESKLEELSCEDFFGTEGWRHFLGLPE